MGTTTSELAGAALMNAVLEDRASTVQATAVPALQISGLHAWYGESHVLHGVDMVVHPARS